MQFWGLPCLGQDDPLRRALDAWEKQLPYLRIENKDLAVSASTPPYLSLGQVESFFSSPMMFPPSASAWLDQLESAESSFQTFQMASSMLGIIPESEKDEKRNNNPLLVEDIPRELAAAVAKLWQSIEEAQPFLDAARESMTDAERASFSELFGWRNKQNKDKDELSTETIRRQLDSINAFKKKDVLIAASHIMKGVDAVLKKPDSFQFRGQKRIQTRHGFILISGSENHTYTAQDLADVILLIDTGGNNTYEGSVAYAQAGQTRIVIDYGDNISILNSNSPTASFAYFGVSVLALPNPGGRKIFTSGDFSQGSSIGGVAALIANGTILAKAGRYAQGSGSGGIGFFLSSGHHSQFECFGYGQGAGFIQGIGLFRHKGNSSRIHGGLVQPDPREPMGAVSFCQGVGYGRRAYSGGGIGLCSLSGDKLSVLASYFAQGSGYWHGAGAFRVRGANNAIQSRRYALGSGTHNAFGHFESLGDGNRITNWGVGPAHGWDRGIGSAIVSGNKVSIQADWGTGTASIGSRSFGYFEGAHTKLKLPWLGNGQLFRNESAYSIQVIAGGPHRIQDVGINGQKASGRLYGNLWGVVDIENGLFVKSLNLKKPAWPEFWRDTTVRQETINLQTQMQTAETMNDDQRMAWLLDIASSFSLDKETPRRALEKLVTLPKAHIPMLVDLLDPAAIEQLIQLSIAITAHGDDALQALSKIPEDHKNFLLAHYLIKNQRPSRAMAFIEKGLDNPSSRIQASAAKCIGIMANSDAGEEPGIKAILESVLTSLTSSTTRQIQATKDMLSRVRLADAFSALNAATDISPQDRLTFLAAGPQDITDKIGQSGSDSFLNLVNSKSISTSRIQSELAYLEKSEPRLRKKLKRIGLSGQDKVLQACLIALGQIGNEDDADWVAPYIKHQEGPVREAAAIALGRMGSKGAENLFSLADSDSARTRSLCMLGAGHATHATIARVLLKGLNDTDMRVAGTAAAAVRFASSHLDDQLIILKDAARQRLKNVKSTELKMNFELLLAS